MNNVAPSRNGRRVGTLLGLDPARLLDDLMTWQPPGSEVVWSAYSAPVSVTHCEDGVTVSVDLPGVSPEDLELTFEAGSLAIAGKRGERTYRYSVELGETIDPDGLDAQLEHGVLTVHARKRPEAKPRKIMVGVPAPRQLETTAE
ncbi:MAG: Hsp20/alpha crystallin family protein [Kofleriaceae bacterium]